MGGGAADIGEGGALGSSLLVFGHPSRFAQVVERAHEFAMVGEHVMSFDPCQRGPRGLGDEPHRREASDHDHRQHKGQAVRRAVVVVIERLVKGDLSMKHVRGRQNWSRRRSALTWHYARARAPPSSSSRN